MKLTKCNRNNNAIIYCFNGNKNEVKYIFSEYFNLIKSVILHFINKKVMDICIYTCSYRKC